MENSTLSQPASCSAQCQISRECLLRKAARRVARLIMVALASSARNQALHAATQACASAVMVSSTVSSAVRQNARCLEFSELASLAAKQVPKSPAEQLAYGQQSMATAVATWASRNVKVGVSRQCQRARSWTAIKSAPTGVVIAMCVANQGVAERAGWEMGRPVTLAWRVATRTIAAYEVQVRALLAKSSLSGAQCTSNS
mmetsp:Transcript_63142/g.112223  ORF Transcript_63142/g.112223 Transcript_63142/m.112223 type:complete len:200 (+) Transcript_63142:125-724(+)